MSMINRFVCIIIVCHKNFMIEVLMWYFGVKEKCGMRTVDSYVHSKSTVLIGVECS